MDPELQRIEEDLRGIVSGDVLCSDAGRALYATDASLFEAWPLAVVRPRTTEEVAGTVRWAAERGISIQPRGAGSGLAGDALGNGIVIDCSRYLRRVIRTGDDDVRVQSGVVAAQLEEHLHRFGRALGPDPANAAVTTIGGMIGRNTSGSRFLRHGATRNAIVSAQAVLADGSIVEVVPTAARSAGPTPSGPSAATDAADPRLVDLATKVAGILDSSAAVIADGQPANRLSHGGYRLDDLRHAPGGLIDLPRLLCGAAGTLAVVTEATVRTIPADESVAVGLLLFDSIEKAADAALRLRPLGPSACDLFDKRHLTLARTAKVSFDLLIPPVADAGLLVEFTGVGPACNARLDEAIAMVQRVRGLCLDVRRAEDDFDARLFWELSRNIVSTLHGVRGTARPVPFIEDIVVPPESLPEFLRRLQSVLKQCAATAMLFAHAGHGQMHVRPYADPRDPADCERLHRLAESLYAEVVAIGGTVGGEMGLGFSRTAFFERFFPELSAVFARVKAVFDPVGTLNPGKIVRGDLGSRSVVGGPPFRSVVGLPMSASTPEADPPPSAVTPNLAGPSLPVLRWRGEGLSQEVDACNGCGTCRSQSRTLRMCPRYRENAAEESSPRAKANLIGALLSGKIDSRALSADAVRAIADTCFNCHQCRVDCAAGVDIPALVTELKAAAVESNSLDTTRWLLSRVDSLSGFGGVIAPVANWAIGNRQARWLIEKALGIAQGRKLPRFTGQRVMRWAARHGLTRPSRRSGPRVLYFLDTYARRHDPLLAKSLVAVLERNGIGVFIDPRQVSSGMPMVSEGDLDGARRLARTNVRVLAEAVRLGYRIICTEPSAVTCLTHDYPLLVDDDDMARVVEATSDATAFLWELHREGRLQLDFQPVSAGVLYHAPCHVRARTVTSPAEHLLRLIPGLSVTAEDRGCSGMAGTYGLSRDNYRSSLRMGLGLASAMRGGRVEAGVTECTACRIQMEQGTTKPTVHTVKLLAKAYGLLPGPDGLDPLLTARSGRLTTS